MEYITRHTDKLHLIFFNTRSSVQGSKKLHYSSERPKQLPTLWTDKPLPELCFLHWRKQGCVLAPKKRQRFWGVLWLLLMIYIFSYMVLICLKYFLLFGHLKITLNLWSLEFCQCIKKMMFSVPESLNLLSVRADTKFVHGREVPLAQTVPSPILVPLRDVWLLI